MALGLIIENNFNKSKHSRKEISSRVTFEKNAYRRQGYENAYFGESILMIIYPYENVH